MGEGEEGDEMSSSEAAPRGQESKQDLRAELSQVEAERAELLQQARDLRSQLADAGPMDAAERGLIITQAEELEALAAELERRRDALLEKLGGSS
ncbi:MAG: hypothetical protein JWN06_3926 [Propionibacteriaceae bacterium]|jgi:hypothetical protein|nr:hypothetical protein [Propionibacteriaceae bacterium]